VAGADPRDRLGTTPWIPPGSSSDWTVYGIITFCEVADAMSDEAVACSAFALLMRRTTWPH
jgi:hypothetical protein